MRTRCISCEGEPGHVLENALGDDILVSMTSFRPGPGSPPKDEAYTGQPLGRWRLQDAKARFSELVRRVRSEGPQHVTVHGRDEVVVISAEAFQRLKGDLTGAALVEALQESPFPDLEIEPGRSPTPVRDVDL